MGVTVLVDVQGLGPTGLPFAAIQSAKLAMTDKLIKATAPLSAEGADEIAVEPDPHPGEGRGPDGDSELDPGLRRGTETEETEED